MNMNEKIDKTAKVGIIANCALLTLLGGLAALNTNDFLNHQRHNSLPASIKSYDSDRDGYLSTEEQKQFAQDLRIGAEQGDIPSRYRIK